eukprot:scaffold53893_cov16-Tisochrysis_lutea.AAC.1
MELSSSLPGRWDGGEGAAFTTRFVLSRASYAKATTKRTAPVHENGVRMFTCARHQDRVNPLSRCMLDCKHEPTPDAQHSAPPPCLYLQADSVASCSKASDERDFLRSLNDQLLSNQKQLRLAAEEARGELASRDATIRELQEQVPSALAYSNCSALTLDFGQQFCMGNGRGPLSPWFHF